MELYNVLVQVLFTTSSKTKLDNYKKKIGRQVALQVAKRLNKLGNIRKISSLGGDIA